MDLFEQTQTRQSQPLARRIRPECLDEVVGQDHLLTEGRLFRRAIEADRLTSCVLYGPPGAGKTSLAEVVARATGKRFVRLSGVQANVAALREAIETAKLAHTRAQGTILFIDEIHRFNKAQQDTLLPEVEDGTVVLIGATTHNPFFFVNGPLLSRSQVFQLEPLGEEAVQTLLRRALQKDEVIRQYRVEADEEALTHLARTSEGDARQALNALEIAVVTTPPQQATGSPEEADSSHDPRPRIRITPEVAEESIQKKVVRYDRDEDEHYDTISAFIKSVRGSDPDAAVYWLAKMLHAGEDPRFVARRLVILASEDIGNADPQALSLASSAFYAVECLGMPEARIPLAQVTTYLAGVPKSNAVYQALEQALADVQNGRVQAVPHHLRDTHYQGAERLGHTGYQYAHNFPDHFVEQSYMEEPQTYYHPTDQGAEKRLKERLDQLRKVDRGSSEKTD